MALMLTRPAAMAAGAVALSLSSVAADAVGATPKDDASVLFGMTNLWEVHFIVRAAEWEKIEPKRDPQAFMNNMRRFGDPATNTAPPASPPDAPAPRPGLAGMMGLEMDFVHADVEFAGRRFTNVALRYKGNGTYVFSQFAAKRPFKVDLAKFGGKETLHGLSTLNFHNGVFDASKMHEALSYDLFRRGGIPAPRTAYAKVHLTVEGKEKRYLGVYTFTEQVDETFLKKRFGTDKGLLLKPSSFRGFGYWGDDWANYKTALNPKGEPTPEQARRTIELFKLVYSGTDEEFAAKIESMIDMDAFVRFIAMNVLLSNLDSFLGMGQNFYVYLDPRSNKFVWLPWDMDISFGAFGLVGTPRDRVELSLSRPYIGDNPFIRRTLAIRKHDQAYRRYVGQYLTTLFEPSKLNSEIDALAKFLRPLVSAESKEASDNFAKALVEPTPEVVRASFPSESPPPRFGANIIPPNPIKAFVVRRAESVRAQLDGKSDGSIVPPMGAGRRRDGPGQFLAEPVTRAADSDNDNKVTRTEFKGLAERWHRDWSKGAESGLNREQIISGVDSILVPPPQTEGNSSRPPSGPSAGAGGFGPGLFVGPALLGAMDANRDRAVSRDELTGAFEKWFSDWDSDKSDSLDTAEIRNGFNKVLAPPGGGSQQPGAAGASEAGQNQLPR